MSLENTIMTAMKESMKSKDQTSLRSLRAIKSAIILGLKIFQILTNPVMI